MVVGDKIRNLRILKGFSQENMSELLQMSLVAYGDIERNKKDVNLKRLEQIAKVLEMSVSDILTFGEKISNFFDQCSNPVFINNGGQTIYNDAREIQHKLDIALLEMEKLIVEKEKAELEAKYWREKV